jgi:PAS domain S-box-containing protein
MRAFYKRFSVVTGFGILLAVLIVNGLVIRRQLNVQVEDQVWVAHTKQVLLQLRLIESLLTDSETGQRGYLYTGNPEYLAPYNLATQQVDTNIQKLAELTGDNPRQQARIPQLRSLSQQKLKELAETISLYRAGNPYAARALVLTDSGARTMERIRELIEEMQQEETSLDGIRIAAYQRSVQVTVACIYLASVLAGVGLILLAYFVLRDISLRDKHAAEIKQREEWFRVTLTSIGDGVIATDEHGNVTFINPVAERLTGRKLAQAKGLPIAEVFPIYSELTRQPVDNPVNKVMQLGHIIGLANHTVLEHTDGTLIPIEDSAAPIRNDQGELAGVVLVFRDATAERKSQDLIRKTEKIAAAARLAATVAHEINNPLEAVSNLIYLAQARNGMPMAALEDLKMAEDELARVSHVTRQTLGFYRESTFPDKVEVSALVDSVLKLYANKISNKNITVERSFTPCPPLQGWAGELRQVVSNLISNAIDAMSTEGTLKIRVSCDNGVNGEKVELRVEDDGPGIAPEHAERIFEPFFTTKKEVGTGLGLYVSKQIVERHGGSIHVHSHSDNGAHGTVFSVLLPCAESKSIGAAKTA